MIIGYGLAPNLIVLLAAAFIYGITFSAIALVWTNTLQEMVPPDMLGKSSSIDALGSVRANAGRLRPGRHADRQDRPGTGVRDRRQQHRRPGSTGLPASGRAQDRLATTIRVRWGDELPDPLLYIRTADARDHDLLARLSTRTFRETFASDNTPEDMSDYLAKAFGPDRQAAELADPGTTFLIAETEGETVGYAQLKVGPAPDCIQGLHPGQIAAAVFRRRLDRAWGGRGPDASLPSSAPDG